MVLAVRPEGSADTPEGVWLYRLVISVLLSIVATLFLLDRFLPYPWLKDKPSFETRVQALEWKIETVEELRKEVERLRKENLEIHGVHRGLEARP